MPIFNAVKLLAITETRERVVVEEVVIEPEKNFLDIRFSPEELATLLAILENQCWHDTNDGAWPSSSLYSNILYFVKKVKGNDWWKFHPSRQREWRKAHALRTGTRMNTVAYVPHDFADVLAKTGN